MINHLSNVSNFHKTCQTVSRIGVFHTTFKQVPANSLSTTSKLVQTPFMPTQIYRSLIYICVFSVVPTFFKAQMIPLEITKMHNNLQEKKQKTKVDEKCFKPAWLKS